MTLDDELLSARLDELTEGLEVLDVRRLLNMKWHDVRPGCGDIVESSQSLTCATAHCFCQI